MGKSNKFDYTNRPNSGAKLGHIIGCALQKEGEKVKKDAERHAVKARKQSTGSSAETAVAMHLIDLIAPSKDLGDEGACAMIDGLEIALKNGTPGASLALQELNLAGNSITTVSLARLAPVIELACYDLKTVSLARNTIKVQGDQEATQFERFLRALQRCTKLDRLELDGNIELGSRGLEVFARVHVLEDDGETPPSSSMLRQSDRFGQESPAGHLEEGDGVQADLDNDRLVTRRRSLRFIPAVTMQNIGLDDTGALWLSYLLEHHQFPDGLKKESGLAPQSSHTAEQCCGVDWRGECALSKESLQLLDRTETLRRQRVLDENKDATSTTPDASNTTFEHADSSRRKSSEARSLKTVQENRRASIRSLRSSDAGGQEVAELESARKRLQRSVIVRDGATSIELWRMALKVISISRHLLYITPTTRLYSSTSPPLRPPTASMLPPVPTVQPPDSPIADNNGKLMVDIAKAASYAPNGFGSYASTLAVEAHKAGVSESVLTDVTNTPATPMLLQKPTHRKGAFSEGNDLHTVTDKLNYFMIQTQDPARFVYYQQALTAKAEEEGRHIRNRSVPCQLPHHILMQVLAEFMTEREMSMLNERQMKAALDWGQRRDTIVIERAWLGKDESAQILMLLDSIDCLSYV